MLRHKTWWLLVALACFVVVVQLCLWIFLMQVQLGLMSAEIRDLSSNVHQSNDFVRDYMHAYASSPIENYVRFFYTYPKSEVESLNNLSQEDPLLIKHITKFLLIRPPKRSKPRVLNYDVSKGQGKRISELFKRKTGGIFVEYGAANDYYESNTLFLEARYNWTGLLIVPNPFNFGLRYAARRNAWLLPVCISLKKSPMMAKFNLERDVNVHCMPLYSILKAFNATSIDFFSLDAQGDELDVLRTLPFDVFDVKNTWLLVALVFLVVVPLWWIFLMQVRLSLMSAEIGELNSIIRQRNFFVRDFMFAYGSSPIEDTEVRVFYTYPTSEVERLKNLSQEHPMLIKHIKNILLIPPPKHPRLRPGIADESRGQSRRISELFKHKTGGIFVECGASNGHHLSNTLYLEANYNWTGLLIEPEPHNFGQLYRFHRNAWLLPACLSLKRFPMMAKFNAMREWSKIDSSGINVHCMPLYSILKAFNATSIDFFSLDVEGNELDVLKTLPFDKVDIKTFAIEFSNIKEGKEHLRQFMISKGYYELPSTQKERSHLNWAQEDCIFVKK
ncbi:Hypothetical predicted protein [Cloeon dipterum]|uniref:Methyltransferase FkbM domain-containing protein n=1 Tax=Cloeon dipterum TaxID=197152 RepID=A0A8S1DVW5_9INSE|nr:Hypothetical predicted protein [Cloeon dipterum]